MKSAFNLKILLLLTFIFNNNLITMNNEKILLFSYKIQLKRNTKNKIIILNKKFEEMLNLKEILSNTIFKITYSNIHSILLNDYNNHKNTLNENLNDYKKLNRLYKVLTTNDLNNFYENQFFLINNTKLYGNVIIKIIN